MTGRLDPASIHASIYLPVFMPILLPILVLFLPVLDMCLAIVRRLAKGRVADASGTVLHLHHRMLRIGHSVRGAVLILWGWAALIAFGSLTILFFQGAARCLWHGDCRGRTDHRHHVPVSEASYSGDTGRERYVGSGAPQRAACHGSA